MFWKFGWSLCCVHLCVPSEQYLKNVAYFYPIVSSHLLVNVDMPAIILMTNPSSRTHWTHYGIFERWGSWYGLQWVPFHDGNTYQEYKTFILPYWSIIPSLFLFCSSVTGYIFYTADKKAVVVWDIWNSITLPITTALLRLTSYKMF